MRRFVLVFMMLLLTFQWTWSAAASVCAHEDGGAHFGHHEHKHAGHQDQSQGDKEQADSKSPVPHADCQGCHGVSVGYVPASASAGASWVPDAYALSYWGHLPEPPLESLLRPPLNLVA